MNYFPFGDSRQFVQIHGNTRIFWGFSGISRIYLSNIGEYISQICLKLSSFYFKIECYTTACVQKQNTTTYKQVWKRFLSFSFFTPSWNLRKFLIAGELKEHHSLLEISSKAVVWPNIAVADSAASYFSLSNQHTVQCAEISVFRCCSICSTGLCIF